MICDMMRGWDEEVIDLRGMVDGIERDYENAKAMAERDPGVRMH